MAETLIRIDPSSPIALYRQVQEAIVAGIAASAFDAKHRLPSSRELAAELEVSRNTINLAYQELLAQGLLISQERRGIFVNPDLTPGQLAAFTASATDTEPEAPITRIDWAARLAPAGDASLPELIKPPDWSEYPFPFLPGQIELAQFPARSWTRCLREALFQPHLAHALQDSAGCDDDMLVEMIRTRLLPSRGVHVRPEEIMITLGTQHGLDLIAEALLKPGDRVLMEDPGYLDLRHIMTRHQACVGEMPVDADGAIVPADLTGVQAVFLTPSHHHPTNVTMSMDRRQAALEAAAASGTVVVEDDYDAEFRYSGQPSPSLKAIDPSGDVVHLGSFSKFLAPGLRLGFLVGPAELIAALRHSTRYTVRHAPGVLQRAMALFLDSGEYHRTLRLNRERMRGKFRLMCDGVAELLPFESRCAFPSGGMSLWFEGPAELDARVLQEAACQRGVLVEPGDYFFAATAEHGFGSREVPGHPGGIERYPWATLRLGYAAIPTRAIRPGLEMLAEVAREVV